MEAIGSDSCNMQPFVIIVPCHRVMEADGYAVNMSANGGAISKRRLLSIEGMRGTVTSKPVFEVLLPVAPPRPQS
jgi:methylated-DNA-[protein]-cysteine S-methyltransferase